MKNKSQVLLLRDVEGHGRTGDIASVAPGHARNYLIPEELAVYATPANLAMQAELQEKRKQQAVQDQKEAEAIRDALQGIQLEIRVKVDPEGHMYGSVNVHDIQELIEQASRIHLDKKSVLLKQPIKAVGVYNLSFRLKEGIMAEGVVLKVVPDVEIPVAEG